MPTGDGKRRAEGSPCAYMKSKRRNGGVYEREEDEGENWNGEELF